MSILKIFTLSDDDKSRAARLAFFLSFTVIVVAIYFLWANFLSFGYLVIEADAPFKIKIYKGPEQLCEVSPCKLKVKTGSKEIIIQKDGYKPITTSISVGLWSTQKIRATLEYNPELIKQSLQPEILPEAENVYGLLVDEISGLQKLVIKDDPLATPLIFFQNPLKDAKIFGNFEKYLLIVDKSGIAFKVDLRAKTRAKIGNLKVEDIVSGRFSPDGRYFIYQSAKSEYLKIIDTDNPSTFNPKFTLLQAAHTRYDWLYDNTLIFVTKQTYAEDSTNSALGDFIKLLSAHSTSNLLLGKYSPFYGEYSKIDIDLPMSRFPEELVSAQSGSEIYLQKGDENLTIILKKF